MSETSTAMPPSPNRNHRLVWIQLAVGLVVVALVIGVTVLALRGSDDDDTTTASDQSNLQRSPSDSSPTSPSDSSSHDPTATTPAEVDEDGAFTVGNPDAPVTVQVVEDFQCPICQQFESVAGDLLAQYEAGDDVVVEYRGISFLDRASSTMYSTRALNASACVMSQGPETWAEFHHQLFLQQPPEGGDGLPDSELVDIATAAGADEAVVASCVDDLQYESWVASTTDAALDDDVSGTPTLFVNGTKLDGFDPAELQTAVDEALGS